jgi:hypothetical protein
LNPFALAQVLVTTCGNRFSGDYGDLPWAFSTFESLRVTLGACRMSTAACTEGYNCSGTSLSTRAHLCPPGQYSEGGATECSLCPSGVYGATAGLTSANCTAPCPVGECLSSMLPDGALPCVAPPAGHVVASPCVQVVTGLVLDLCPPVARMCATPALGVAQGPRPQQGTRVRLEGTVLLAFVLTARRDGTVTRRD